MPNTHSTPALITPTLFNVGWRYLLRHPWQSVLMVVGITLGVSVVVSIDLANASASRAFDLSTDAIVGRATHQVVGGPQGLDEALYTELRLAGLPYPMAPVASDYLTSPQMGDRPLQVLGIDPFAEAPFRSYLGGEDRPRATDLTSFLTRPGALLVSTDVAEQYGLAIGDRIQVEIAGYTTSGEIVGLLAPNDSFSRRALDSMVIADVATVQELTGEVGQLDRIDLILPENDPAARQQIEALLPDAVRLQPVEARSNAVQQMTAAFRTNLTALSLLALIVGMFLIYNTMTFSVIQRRPLFGTLRCLGVTRREIFTMVVGEAVMVGTFGGLLGLVLGVVMGQGAVRLVTQTMNDFFFTVSVRGVQIPVESLLKGGGLGLLTTIITAAVPAWEAAAVPPRAALSRAGLEQKARQMLGWLSLGGVVLIAGGGVVLSLQGSSLGVSFLGTLALLVGFAMLAPQVTVSFMRGVTRPAAFVWGALGRMAPRGVVNALSRTSVAVASLMVAVSVTIGVSLMIGSFRQTVVTWLGQTLTGDIFFAVPETDSQVSPAIDPAVIAALAARPDVTRVDLLRTVTVDSPDGPATITASNISPPSDPEVYITAEGTPEELWEMMLDGAVVISEPYANRVGIPLEGGTVTLYTPQGERDFPVVGVYYSYSSPQGVVAMAGPLYQEIWGDQTVTAAVLTMDEGVDIDAATAELQAELIPLQQLLIRANQTLRDDALEVFDRTFAITGAMQMLTILVAFVGVLSALLSLQLEKQRELGILRAIGLTARQLWGLVMLETGLMGMVAGLLAMPAGLALSLILIYIINKRSFGWTIQLQLEAGPFVQALGVAVVAALLAGLYPAWRLGRMTASEALRFE